MLGVDIDRKEHAERDQKHLRLLVDAEPQDHQWNQREMRHVADHLQRWLSNSRSERCDSPLASPKREADAAPPMAKPDDGAPEAHPDVVEELAASQQFPSGDGDVGRRRQDRADSRPALRGGLPDQRMPTGNAHCVKRVEACAC